MIKLTTYNFFVIFSDQFSRSNSNKHHNFDGVIPTSVKRWICRLLDDSIFACSECSRSSTLFVMENYISLSLLVEQITLVKKLSLTMKINAFVCYVQKRVIRIVIRILSVIGLYLITIGFSCFKNFAKLYKLFHRKNQKRLVPIEILLCHCFNLFPFCIVGLLSKPPNYDFP